MRTMKFKTLSMAGMFLCLAGAGWVQGQKNNGQGIEGVRVTRECKSKQACIDSEQQNRKTHSYKLENKRLVFYQQVNGAISLLNTREIRQPDIKRKGKDSSPLEVQGINENVFLDPEGDGVVITSGKVAYEGLVDVSHEVLDSSGNLVTKILGANVPDILLPAPGFQYFVGLKDVDGRKQPPIVLFNRSGKEYSRINDLFPKSGDINIVFSGDGRLIGVSAKNAGIAVISSDGVIKWRKPIPGWAGDKLQFLIDAGKIVVLGKTVKRSGEETSKHSAEEVSRMSIDERRRLLLPTKLEKNREGLYCFSTVDGSQLWFEPNWKGTISSHPGKDIFAVVGQRNDNEYTVGLFDSKGFIRSWTLPKKARVPEIKWLKHHFIVLLEDAKFEVVSGHVVKQLVSGAAKAAFLMNPEKRDVIWEKTTAGKGFDLETIGDRKFVVADGTATVMEVR